MTPQQAVQIIEQVRQVMNLSGKEHDQVREAVHVLDRSIVRLMQLEKELTNKQEE